MTEDNSHVKEKPWETQYRLQQEEKQRLKEQNKGKVLVGTIVTWVIVITIILGVPWLKYSFRASTARYISGNCGNPEWVSNRWVNSNWFCK